MESRLLRAIGYKDDHLQMPPTGKLSSQEIATLKKWVALGVPWPDEPLPSAAAKDENPFDVAEMAKEHWAWQPLRRHEPPAVESADWADTSVDRFILAKLEESGLSPADETDRRTLIRRLYFDLIGLPPTSLEVEAFVSDERPDAYERLVNSLLDSPHFGERWGRHWLDLVRFAETYGHEQDYPVKHAWKYRDYVIRALNADVPYDQFLTEHIAGDLIEHPRRNPEQDYNESIIATGFWFMHQATHAPVDVRQDEADRIDNQIDVFSKAFMGMTVACARCHDHKFDAISTKDYYSLYGFLQSSRQQFAFLDPGHRIQEGVEELKTVREKGRRILADGLRGFARNRDAGIKEYLSAAREVRYGDWKPEDGEALLRSPISYESFEDDPETFSIMEGAFHLVTAEEVSENQRRLGGYEGKRFLSSYSPDGPRLGIAESAPFLVERRYIRFRAGGSGAEESVNVSLVVDGEAVRTAGVGQNERLREVLWDVEEFRGKPASLRVEDNEESEGQWISVDAIEFIETLHKKPLRRSIEQVARERQLDASRLEKWVRTLQKDEVEEPNHPLYVWTNLEKARNEDDFAAAVDELRDELSGRRSAWKEAARDNVVYETFDDGSYDGWFRTGHAFTERPAMAGDWRPSGQPAGIPATGVAHSGLIDDKLQGVLRSPTFTITHDNIHIRMAGRGTQIRLVVEGYQLVRYNGLLFGRTLVNVNTGGDFVWHNMTRDVRKWVGRKAYIELVDEGDGYIAVDEIRFSNNDPAGERTWSRAKAVLGSDDESRPADLEELAQRYEAETISAARNWGWGATSQDQNRLLAWFLDRNLVSLEETNDELAQLSEDSKKVAAEIPGPMRVIATVDGSPEPERVFIRGSHSSLGEEAPRSFLDAVAGADQEPIEKGSGRLELARRLLSPENPLPARVLVNRVWHHLFGKGIVESVDNFGVTGADPTHPQLLDYLAVEFRDNGWSIKKLIKRLCLTRAYRMKSDLDDPVALAQDPENKLLHRMNVKRLEGEVIRDAVLATAGRLDHRMFGDSVPAYLSPFIGGHRRPAESGPMDGDRRRSIYLEVRRNYLLPMMLAFDMPVPDSTIGRRTESNMPAQALILMNDPFVVEQAKAWGERVCKMRDKMPCKRIDAIYGKALGRPPSPDERKNVYAFLDQQAAEYGLTRWEGYQDPRVWTDLCHVMFTLKEFIYIG